MKTTNNAYYLAIDQGTHATRSVIFDCDGNLVDIEWREISLKRLSDSHIEQDAPKILQSVIESVNTILERQPMSIRSAISACGISTQRSTVVACNSKGATISPAISWQDVRGQDYLQSIKLHHEEIQKNTRLPVSAHYGASKLHWLTDHLSDQKDLLLGPLISYLLTNLLDDQAFVVDHSNAQRTQLMDLSTLNWSEQLCRWFSVPENSLPTCKPLVENYGKLLKSDIAVTAACGDQNAAVFGSGAFPDTDTAIINLGSGAFILRTIPEYEPKNQLLTGIAYTDHEKTRYLREGTVNGAGTAIKWVKENYAIDELFETLPDWLTQIQNPPVFINTIGNLGSPWWRHDINPEFINADFENKPALVVAVIESIVFLLMDNFLIMNAEQPIKHIRVSGGLSRLDGLCQKLANLMQLPVERFDTPEATARGCAWLAAGLPTHWQLNTEATFYPKLDDKLKERYKLFQAELKHRLDASQPMIPQLVAHRGYMNKYPENTLIGLKAALKAGAPYIEFDIQLNADSEFIVIHDSNLIRTTGIDGSVFNFTTSALKKISAHEPGKFEDTFYPEPIPALSEVLTLLERFPESKAMVEIKEESLDKWGHEQVMQKLFDALSKHSNQCIVISFDHQAITYTKNNSTLKTGWVLHKYDERHQKIARELSPDYLICNYRKLPEKKSPWTGPWEWMFYDIIEPEIALELASRGATLIETAEIKDMLSHLTLKKKALVNDI